MLDKSEKLAGNFPSGPGLVTPVLRADLRPNIHILCAIRELQIRSNQKGFAENTIVILRTICGESVENAENNTVIYRIFCGE